jgi:phosphoribosylglycinamide formyltransferase 1
VKKIAILASGQGSNAFSICTYFSNHPGVKVVLIGSNKANAGVLMHAEKFGIPTLVFSSQQMKKEDFLKEFFLPLDLDLIVLAGFLLMIPPFWLEYYPKKIINIHPALLPKYGGKGMFGSNVHQAVKASGDPESGITIHYVDEKYDQGEPIVQVKCPVFKNDSPEEIAARVLKLEHFYFPRTIEKLLE